QHVLPRGRRPGAPALLQGARGGVHRVLLRLARLHPAPEGLPPGGADQGAAEHARGAEGRARGGRPPDRRARGDRAGDRDVRGARRGPAHLRALDPHPGPAVRARVDRDLRHARAPEVRHGSGAPHDAPARGGAQGAGGMSAPVWGHVMTGGESVRAAGGTYPVIDPATEEPAGHAPECSVEQVRAAARAARAAFERGPWRTMSGAERAARLAEAAERFKREAPGLVDLTIAETGAVLPPGVLNFVGGQGPEIGEALVLAPEVDMISFTGSSAVGARIQEAVAPRMKRVLLELGGKSPNLVFADADPAQALAGALQPWTFHTGQACIAGTRLLVEHSMYDDFAARLVEAGRALRVGDPRAPV